MSRKLERTTFTMDRSLEFFSEKELSMQIGHAAHMWPAAILKELVDNALDACEGAGVAPEITVELEADAITITDNGPGIPADTLAGSLDYMVRLSDKAHYVAPTRGQLGNALMCAWAAPFVASGTDTQVEVHTQGRAHEIHVSLDQIAQRPRVEHVIAADPDVKNGTCVKMHWPRVASYLLDPRWTEFYKLVATFACFNPHANFTAMDPRGRQEHAAALPAWRKWLPSTPTCASWYSVPRLQGLLAAYIDRERQGGPARTVRQFVSEFAGLAGSAKQKLVTDACGLSGAWLRDLVAGGAISTPAVERLLDAMCEHTRPVKPQALGVIGEEHIMRWVTALGVGPGTVRYARVAAMAADIPFVLELGFGVGEEGTMWRQLFTGLNWSSTLSVPCEALYDALGDARATSEDPVVVVMHLACPRLEFTDRGKTKLHLPQEIVAALAKAVATVSKDFTAAKRRADRQQRSKRRLLDDMQKSERRKRWTVKDAASQVMEAAYLHASANGTLPANARQIMYAARPGIIELTGKARPWSTSAYFTQVLLPDFIEQNPDATAGWDVVFDARGKLLEPHTEHRVDLGTLQTRAYVQSWRDMPALERECPVLSFAPDTTGPSCRYRFALFLEKEGFDPLLDRAALADRFDIAIMSTKGMSVTAARYLVEEMSGQGVTILVVRDFDAAGFCIAHTLAHSTRRWKYTSTPRVIDLGLRLEDVEDMDLQREETGYDSGKDPREHLREIGATAEECAVLVSGGRPGRWRGERVELNAMTSGQLIGWLERKLTDAGARKVVPDEAVLQAALRAAVYKATIQRAIDEAAQKYEEADLDLSGLEAEVAKRIEKTDLPWESAIQAIARERAR